LRHRAKHLVCSQASANGACPDSRGELFVALADGEVVGCGALTRDSGSLPELGTWPASWAILRRLAVAPSHRGHGIARGLVAARVARARELGA
jgi:predicted N-acetyltransferase YhbS